MVKEEDRRRVNDDDGLCSDAGECLAMAMTVDVMSNNVLLGYNIYGLRQCGNVKQAWCALLPAPRSATE